MNPFEYRLMYYLAQSLAINPACFNTVSVAFFSLSGGYPYFLKIFLTFNLISACTLSLWVQSIVTLLDVLCIEPNI